VSLEVFGATVRAGDAILVREASLRVDPGECFVLMGESGSGKSLLAHAIMGDLAPGLRASGEIRIGGARVDGSDARARRALWGREIALLPQEPWTALDPLMRADAQIAETAALVARRPWRMARAQADGDLAALGLAGEGGKAAFRLSGGMAQRVAIAATMAAGARALIADEPTKGLDAQARASVAASLLAERDKGTALLVVTHDIEFARLLGGRIAIMREAEIVESGETRAVLAAPSHPYAREFVAADPANWPPAPAPAPSGELAIEAKGLAGSRGGRKLFADVDLALARGQIAVVEGPSGGGKTTLGAILLGLIAPAAGRVARDPRFAATRYQKLYQDPVAAFAPDASLATALEDVVRKHRADRRTLERTLARLGIAPALLARRPDQVSGGELQRVALARALCADPVFLFADEPTSRLDPPNQRVTMELLRGFARERGMGVLLVTHDPALARAMSERKPLEIGAR
jgi:peptide/nickel transport system ATP-binding protein